MPSELEYEAMEEITWLVSSQICKIVCAVHLLEQQDWMLPPSIHDLRDEPGGINEINNREVILTARYDGINRMEARRLGGVWHRHPQVESWIANRLGKLRHWFSPMDPYNQLMLDACALRRRYERAEFEVWLEHRDEMKAVFAARDMQEDDDDLGGE